MKLPVFMAVAAIGLSACSGGGAAVTYAKPGDKIQGGSSFATQDVKRFVRVNGGISLKDQTIKVSISDDGQTVYVTQNYKDYVLTASAPGIFTDGNALFFRDVFLSDVVETVYFSDFDPGYFNGGYVVIGYQTVPAQVAARAGSATYNGYTSLTARTLTENGFAGGAVTLTANFGAGSVTGTMNIVDSNDLNADFIVPNTTVTINPGNVANISGSEFAADMAFAITPAPGDTISIGQSGLNGAFYGVDAVSVGATYWATGTYNGQALFIEGALASD